MLRKKSHRLFAILMALVMAFSLTGMALAKGSVSKSLSTAFWWWDEEYEVGKSVLVRYDDYVRGYYKATGLTPGDAVTLWFMVFNNPDGCSTSPCSIPADVFNPDAEADFLWGGGQIVGGDGMVMMKGNLNVGDISGSGMPEIGFGELALGLTDSLGAEVHLAIHSHGPAQSGEILEAQLGSFTGGCEVFNGPNGFAAGPGDLPDAVGECSTIQNSIHSP